MHHDVTLARLGLSPVNELGRQTFAGRISLIGVDENFSLVMMARHRQGELVNAGTIDGIRTQLSSTENFDKLILLTSSGRSGSTWIVHLLSQHEKLAYYKPFTHELRITENWAPILRRIAHPLNLAAVIPGRSRVKLPDDLEVSGKFPPIEPTDRELFSQLEKSYVDGALQSTRGELRRALDLCRSQIPGATQKSRLIEKNASTWLSLVRKEWLPGAIEILLVRDPRDTIASWIQYSRRSGKEFVPSLENEEFVRFASYHTTLFNSYMHLHRRDPDGTILVRYEDLIQAPERTLQGILKGLKLDHSDKLVAEMIAKAQDSRSGAQKHHQTSESAESSIDRWARDLDPVVAGHIQSRLSEAMSYFGYQPQ